MNSENLGGEASHTDHHERPIEGKYRIRRLHFPALDMFSQLLAGLGAAQVMERPSFPPVETPQQQSGTPE